MILSKREHEVIELIVEGYNNYAISSMLAISEETVKRHTSHIYRKMHVISRLHLAVKVLNERHQAELASLGR